MYLKNQSLIILQKNGLCDWLIITWLEYDADALINEQFFTIVAAD